jgi:hypothetical protein
VFTSPLLILPQIPQPPPKNTSEEAKGFAHRRFDVQGLDVLPVLFQEGNEEVDAYEEKTQKSISC